MERNRRSPIASRASTSHGVVVTYSTRSNEGVHEAQTREAVAAKLATIQQFDFAGPYDPKLRYKANLYFIPSDTLIGLETAATLGIRAERDLFGGVVPYAFAATKTITHPLVDKQAHAPVGWSRDFAAQVDAAVLHGYAAFS